VHLVFAGQGGLTPWGLVVVSGAMGLAMAGLFVVQGGRTAWPERWPASHRAIFVRREVRLTTAGLAVTLAAALLSVAEILIVLADRVALQRWGPALAQGLFLLIVAYLAYGACVYHLARLGHLKRLLAHVPASDEALAGVYVETEPPLVTVLVPSYMEDARVVRRTLLCAALQEYPRRRVVLLIDDPPSPANEPGAALLRAARSLPLEIEALLDEPRKLCRSALEAFSERRTAGPLDPSRERIRLAELLADIAAWFERQADGYEIVDHADRLFVETTLRGPARDLHAQARRADAAARDTGSIGPCDASTFLTSYARLLARFQTELVSFERKRYENLSHAANKAMNLNSYIGLLGRSFHERRCGAEIFLEPAGTGRADLAVPDSEFLLIVDADSLLTPDYALRLIHLMRLPGRERVAIAQTPYNSFPGAPTGVERIAGATTDIQYLIHQGFTRYGATYWVGANAVVRTAALVSIATHGSERGHEITRFIRDRTVIEDTESTVDLLAGGWRLYNYPERLAYSETPPDFGSLLIQRRRWANGGLIILPKLLRHLAGQPAGRGSLLQGLMMTHYLTSLTAVNAGLLVVLAFSFEDSIRNAWLPLTAIPYYLLYARDLRAIGYRTLDLLRVYALNLVLIPVNLVGVLGSLEQAIAGKKAAFGRTPKVKGRTRVPAIYLIAEYGILAQWLTGLLRDLLQGRPLHAVLTVANIGFLAYGIARFIGIRHSVHDLTFALRLPRRSWRAAPPASPRAKGASS
jgi:cellulose synthase/poly-beta-1,6-N-acetylglucosamine synthase-like glycosyltransferase